MNTQHVMEDLIRRCQLALGRLMTREEKVELLMDNFRVIQCREYAVELIETYEL